MLFDKNRALVALCLALVILAPSGMAASLRFAGVHYLEPAEGEKKKPKQLTCSVIFDRESVRVIAMHGARTVSDFRYDDVKTITYSRSKQPRWKAGAGLAVAAGVGLALPLGVLGLPVVFAKAKHHWLTLQGERSSNFLALRLSKKNYELVLTAAQAATGVEVERLVR